MHKIKRNVIKYIDDLVYQLYFNSDSEEEIKEIYDEIKLINIKHGYSKMDKIKKRDQKK